VGGWESVAAHNVWIASETNQTIMHELKDMIAVESLRHIYMDPTGFPGEDTSALEVLVFELSPESREETSKASLKKFVDGLLRNQGKGEDRCGWNVENDNCELVVLRSIGERGEEQVTSLQGPPYLPKLRVTVHKLH
jgi:hypothetical protein